MSILRHLYTLLSTLHPNLRALNGVCLGTEKYITHHEMHKTYGEKPLWNVREPPLGIKGQARS